VDTAGNVGGLLVDADKDLAGVAGETLGLDGAQIVLEGVEANLADLITDDLLVIEVGGGGDLTEDLCSTQHICFERFHCKRLFILAGNQTSNRIVLARAVTNDDNKN